MKAEDAASLDKAVGTPQGLSRGGVDERAVVEDEPKPEELFTAGTEVTPPEGVQAATLAATQAPQDAPIVAEKGSSSHAAP